MLCPLKPSCPQCCIVCPGTGCVVNKEACHHRGHSSWVKGNRGLMVETTQPLSLSQQMPMGCEDLCRKSKKKPGILIYTLWFSFQGWMFGTRLHTFPNVPNSSVITRIERTPNSPLFTSAWTWKICLSTFSNHRQRVLSVWSLEIQTNKVQSLSLKNVFKGGTSNRKA